MRAALYASGFLVGVSVVVFPAAGNLFRSANAHALSAGELGLLFAPMILAAILASTAAGPLAARVGLRRVYLGGLGALAAAMALLAATAPIVANHSAAYHLLLVSHAFLGAGFGATMTALNSYAPRLGPPERAQSSLTALHAIVGLGTIVPPLVLPRLAAHGLWWLFPIALGAVIIVVATIAASRPLDRLVAPATEAPSDARGAAVSSLALFCVVAALYGLLEALFGDWGPVFLHDERALDGAAAGLALSFFWAAVTAGRVTVAVATRWISPRAIHVALPLVVAAALLVTRGVSGPVGAALALAVGGLGCSSFLPLTIGAAAAANPRRSETAAGLAFAAYLAGNGAGGSGVGVVRDLVSVPIGAMYLAGAAVAVTLVFLAARSLSPTAKLG